MQIDDHHLLYEDTERVPNLGLRMADTDRQEVTRAQPLPNFGSRLLVLKDEAVLLAKLDQISIEKCDHKPQLWTIMNNHDPSKRIQKAHPSK